MDLQSIKEATFRIVSEGKDVTRAKYSHLGNDVSDRFVRTELAYQLNDFLNSLPEFKKVMLRSGNASAPFSLIVSQRLIQSALHGSLEAELKWLERVSVIKKAPAIEILPIWGVDLSTGVQLLDNLEIVPFNDLPESPQKAGLSSPGFTLYGAAASYAWSPPTAALIAHWMVDPVLYRADLVSPDISIGDHTFLRKILPVLTVIAPSSVMPSISWYEYENSELNDTMLGGGHSSQLAEINPLELRSFGDFLPSVASDIVGKYLSLSGDIRARLERALNRFDRAMRRHQPEDAAVELAIALESLLVNEGGELTWKVGLRSALLLEGSKEQKVEARKIVRGVYRLRGMVVHTGSAQGEIEVQGLGRMKTQDLLAKGAVVAASIIRTLILRGNLPDWFDAEISNDFQ